MSFMLSLVANAHTGRNHTSSVDNRGCRWNPDREIIAVFSSAAISVNLCLNVTVFQNGFLRTPVMGAGFLGAAGAAGLLGASQNMGGDDHTLYFVGAFIDGRSWRRGTSAQPPSLSGGAAENLQGVVGDLQAISGGTVCGQLRRIPCRKAL